MLVVLHQMFRMTAICSFFIGEMKFAIDALDAAALRGLSAVASAFY